ncbi:GT4 family glycosyltransferase PelF [Salinisphaera aquimarina]|uniref:GT4 family glycosyltransferase PelF n=1 Tax=Salinisphaera aquimarina TaxID=2094031 RepID=A0ABV7ESK8_9GAMM
MKKWPTLKAGDEPADVTLLLEGTFPMVRGGVSGWVDQLIRGLPHRRFALIFMGGSESAYKGILYDRPENVVHLECHYLMDAGGRVDEPRQYEGSHKAFGASDALHRYFKSPADSDPGKQLCDIAQMLGRDGGLSHEDFLYSRQAWEQIVDYYRKYCTDPSFVDYFWSVRNMHSPLFMLARIARAMPPTRCLHAISTGYAGFLGALAHHIHALPFIVTEHGIYTKERQIDLTEAEWIKTYNDVLTHGFRSDVSYIRRLWIRFFDGIGRLTYSAANPITTLYEGNRERQIIDGARAERTRVIPNGIDIARFRPLRETTFNNTAPIIALIGRVTPIKEIKTFVRAMRIVATHLPGAQGWIVGPESEDPEYAQECRDLAEQLDLNGTVKFMGFQRTEDVMSQIRLATLTSISEAQPLVALEAMASGLPVVCTDVGSCYELVHGHPKAHLTSATTGPDMAHAAGRIVPIADPGATAAAMLDLLVNRAAWESARAIGIARVDAQYSERLMLDRYEHLYEETAAAPGRTRAAGE